ncbi:MAG TPA: hypothetical protein VIF62_20160 [Labilithrix sp.]
MRMRGAVALWAVAVTTAAAVACGSNGATSSSSSGGSSGTSGSSGDDQSDDGGTTLPDGGKAPPPPPPPVDAGWDGHFTGPLGCTAPATFMNNSSGSCGAERWSIKTGADTAASGIDLLPTLTTIMSLSTLPTQSSFPATTRIKPTEATAFALKDVRLAYVRLEDDSDYHIVLASPVGQTMITEIPYPGNCTSGSTWQCELTRTRAALEAHVVPQLNVGKTVNFTVSVIGVGFFDPEHGQFGALPNGVELHPLLAMCFGAGCDPTE